MRILSLLIHGGEGLLAVNLLVLLIVAFAKQLRSYASGLLFVSSSYWMIALLAWCSAQVYLNRGVFLTVFGLLVGGVGIVPVAFVCLALARDWGAIIELLFQVALVWGSYRLAVELSQQWRPNNVR